MARKSVKEILEAARQGGPVAGSGDTPADAAVPAPPPPAETGATAAPPPSPRPAVAPAPNPGRPLTLKEKLAAARAGAAPAPASAPSEAVDEVAEAAPTAPPPAPAPTPSELGRPLTLAEKLAAARGQGGAAAGPKPAAKAPGAGTTAKPAAPAAKAAPKRDLPPLAEISDPKDLAEALRQTGAKHDAAVAAAAKAAQPAPAAKPVKKEAKPDSVLPRPTREAAQETAGADPSARRRPLLLVSGLSAVAVAWGSFTAGLLAFTAMLGRFMFPNVLAEPPSTIKIGAASNYDPESVNERFKAEWGFWIVRSTRYNGEDIIYALQSVCTHLGCPPNWLEGEQKFKCPCHGSGFYISGVNFEGPAPRPLERFKITVADDGQMVVDKSQKYQQELDQWSDPESFVAAV